MNPRDLLAHLSHRGFTIRAEGNAAVWRPLPRPEATHRVVCVPFSGGNAAIFDSWATAFPSDVELCAVEMPGRGTRANSPAPTSIQALVDDCVQEVSQLADRPIVIFGHSLGALIAFELSRALEIRCPGRLRQLVVSAFPAPHCGNVAAKLAALPVSQELFLHEAIGAGLVARDERRQRLPRRVYAWLRSDLELCARYAYVDRERLSAGITALWAREDPIATASDMARWQKHTSGRFRVFDFPGSHFYMFHSRPAVVETVLELCT